LSEITTIYGALLCVVGDVPASNFLGGFKEGVGFALRKCRMCLATKTDMSTKFHASEFRCRNCDTHNDYIELIEEDGGHRSKHSVTYGINSRSHLSRLIGFDITKCLPYDMMHTIFEGVAMLHLRPLLYYLIDIRKLFSIEQLNLNIRSHKYGYSEVSTKPSKISKDSSTNTYVIKQSVMCF
jgi:hypothetical protein